MRRASSYKLGLGGQAGATQGQEPKAWDLVVGVGVRGRPQDLPPNPAGASSLLQEAPAPGD